jgi:hypothetical protein
LSKKEKLITRLRSKPKDFRYDELEILLGHLGYEEMQKGKTGGSRRAFINIATQHIIRLHKPHPGNILKGYQIDYIIDELNKKGLL